MKTSVSIPDDLWDRVKNSDEGPSAVIQKALSMLAERQADPMANAPSEAVRSRMEGVLAAQAESRAGDMLNLLESGYELGVVLAGRLDLVDLETLPIKYLEQNLHKGIEYATIGQENFVVQYDPCVDLQDLLDDDPETLETLGAHWSNPDFCSYFFAVLDLHIQAAAEADMLPGTRLEKNPGGEIELSYTNPSTGNVAEQPWPRTPLPDGVPAPPPSPIAGRQLFLNSSLPAAYARGIASGLTDARSATLQLVNSPSIGTKEGDGQ